MPFVGVKRRVKSYSAYFVRTTDLEKARAVLGVAEPLLDSPWLMCAFRSDASPPKDEVIVGEVSLTEAISAQLGEIFFVYGDTSVEGFVYEHACDGKLLRKLVWFPMLDDDWTAGWVYVAGEPEDWEKALFRPDDLERCLYNGRMGLQDEGRSDDIPEFEAEIREIWERGEILAGKTFPRCDGTGALLVEKCYGIDRFPTQG